MSADLRRFEYPLEPLRRQRQWQLEAAMSELGRLVAARDAVTREQEELQGRLEAAQAPGRFQTQGGLDPTKHQGLLRWLGQLRDAIHALAERARALEAERLEQVRRCLERQRAVEVLDQHREEEVRAFLVGESGRQAREADQDWLSRMESTGGRMAGSPTARRQGGEP